MTKPLFRFTVGSCLPQGLAVLEESLRRTLPALGVDRFDWMICHNGLDALQREALDRMVQGLPVTLFEQDWTACPIDDRKQSPRRVDGTLEWNGNRCGGTLWKVCPPRMRLESHEIVLDNDIVILRGLQAVDDFLATSNRALILEEPIRFYGRYNDHFGPGGPFLNSGMMGLPPGYDFGQAIRQTWEQHGRLRRITQADEQGLLMLTLSRLPNVRVHPTQMKEVLARDFQTRVDGNETAIHFTQVNRIPSHRAWRDYLALRGEAAGG